MAKIEQLYEAVVSRDDAFLSFIPIALPFDAKALSQAGDGLAGGDALAALEAAADFAILANYIPPVADIWSQDGRLLWDVYERVLSDARLAAPALTDGERQRLREAQALLTDPATGEPTATFLRYQELQSAYLQAKERQAAAMLTAENSTDPAVIAEWEAKEDGLRGEVEAALTKWRTLGSLDAIDEALAVDAHLSGLNPAVRFADARDRLQRAKRTALAAGTGTFFDTAYLPREMFAPQTVWTTVELDASEIESLTAGAEDDSGSEGAADDQDDGDDLEIKRLSVEIGRADVLRDWFDVDLITSHSWQWRFDSPELSDGGDPPQGSLPAFVTAMLFVRNLEVELEPDSISNRALVADMQAGKPMLLGNIVLQQVASTMDASTVTKLTSAKAGLQSHSIAALTARMVAPDAGPAGSPAGGSPASGPDVAPDAPASGPALFMGHARPATLLAARMASTAAPTARGISRPGAAPAALAAAARVARVTRPTVRDHRSISGRPRVRDHRTSTRPERPARPDRPDRPRPTRHPRPRVRDHRSSWGRSRLEEILGRDRIVVRVPSERNSSGVGGTVTAKGAAGANGQPLEGARVAFTDRGGKVVRSVVTDADGAYRARLAPGLYVAAATFEGFAEFAPNEPLEVRRDAMTALDIELVPAVAEPEVHRQAGIQLIAVLCRELPKAPDPDPNLDWS